MINRSMDVRRTVTVYIFFSLEHRVRLLIDQTLQLISNRYEQLRTRDSKIDIIHGQNVRDTENEIRYNSVFTCTDNAIVFPYQCFVIECVISRDSRIASSPIRVVVEFRRRPRRASETDTVNALLDQ